MDKQELLSRVTRIGSEVAGLVGDRHESYGDPVAMFMEIARRWGCEPHEAARRMADLKLARLRYGFHEDSIMDAIAYLMFSLILDEIGASAADIRDRACPRQGLKCSLGSVTFNDLTPDGTGA